jgi:hypothetical protein
MSSVVTPAKQLSGQARRALATIDRQMIGAVAVSFLATRVLLLAVIFASGAALPVLPGASDFAFPGNIMWDGLIRFDSWWYLDIIRNGYHVGSADGAQGTVAFFPGYPLSVRLLSHFTGGNDFVAGLVVSNAGFLIALALLYLWARREYGHGIASRFVFYLAAAPTALFFSAMYTEGLFLALIAATFLFASSRRWVLAALFGAAASATRNTGVLMAGVIALEGLHAAGVRFRPPAWSIEAIGAHLRRQLPLVPRAYAALLAAVAACFGLFAYMMYLWREFDDPFAFVNAQAQWGRSTSAGGVLDIFSNTREQLYLGQHFWLGDISVERLGNVLATLAFLPLVIACFRSFRASLALFTLVAFVIPLLSGSVGSMSRYVLTLAPCYLLLAIWGERPWVDRLVVIAFLPLFALNAALFSHWYFIG